MEEDAWGAPETNNNNKRGSSLYTKPSSHQPLLVLKELIEEVERGGRKAMEGAAAGIFSRLCYTRESSHFKLRHVK